MVVHAPGGDEDRVARAAAQRRQQRAHVVAGGRCVGDVHQAVEALAGEHAAERGVVLAVGDDRLHAGGHASGVATAVQHGHLVAIAEQRPHEMKADELRAADDEDAHQASEIATQVVVRVTPLTAPISSVTRRPIASRVGPSTTAMKS